MSHSRGRSERSEHPAHPSEDRSSTQAHQNFERERLFGEWHHVPANQHVSSAHKDPLWLDFTNPYGQTAHRGYSAGAAHEASSAHPIEHAAKHLKNAESKHEEKQVWPEHDRQKLLSSAKEHLERTLSSNPHDFRRVFEELDHLREKDGKNIEGDLKHINEHLHEKGLLKGLSIIRDDRDGGHGWAVVADDKSNIERHGHRDKTMVSTSHAPHQSAELRHHYHGMHYRRGHYNGWHHSVEGGGGAHGGFDEHAVGGHVPQGARREMIEKALQLAGVPVTEQNISAVNKIVVRESGWNPNITNHWDSNAKAGHPSTGLMQTIPSTFKAYALPGMNNNIHDPLSNLVAGIRYAEHRYGRHGVSGVARVASRPGGY